MLKHKNYRRLTIKSETDEKQIQHLPKEKCRRAVDALSRIVGKVDAVFDNFGNVRTIRSLTENGLYPQPFNGPPRAHAQRFLNTPQIKAALRLRNVSIVDGETIEFPWGYRIEWTQITKIRNKSYSVREGYVHASMRKDGTIFNISSTLRYGRKPSKLTAFISKEKAISAAKSKWTSELGKKVFYSSANAALTFSSHENELNPIWEVSLITQEPRDAKGFLVSATNGKVVHAYDMLYNWHPPIPYKKEFQYPHCLRNVPIRTFLRIPDPNRLISSQIFNATINTLPDATVLENENLTVYIQRKKTEHWQKVSCKSDGTFRYSITDPEFRGAITFFALNNLFALARQAGLIRPPIALPIFVHDYRVKDNAFVEMESKTMHIGVGTGRKKGGLAKFICYDLGVGAHELGHWFFFIHTPGKDMRGMQGCAAHEGGADIFSIWLMFWMRKVFADILDESFTYKDVIDDFGYVGTYAMPPFMRSQRNTKTIYEAIGEPHEDGEIIGGALFDLLVGMCRPNLDLETWLMNFLELYLAAAAILPAHKVTWREIGFALVTQDHILNRGVNKELIEDSFHKHGIQFASVTVEHEKRLSA